MPTIAVVGATGNIGRPLVSSLRKHGVTVRAIGRSTDRLAPLAELGAEPQVGSADDARFLAAAFRGADAVFAMVPPNYGSPDPRAHQRRVTEAMAAGVQVARVRRVVTLSSVGADLDAGTGPVLGLRELEQRFNQVPAIDIVHLRPGYFLENVLPNIGLIKAAGINGGMLLPDLPMAMVATRDIAQVASELLRAPKFVGRVTREIQGARDVTNLELTRAIGAAIGRPDLPYITFGEGDFHGALMGAGFSAAAADEFIEMFHAFNSGRAQMREPRGALNTTPTTIEEFAQTVFAPAFNR
jgi:uncharacterized protein YbjT (DUF2867 family)